MEDTPLKLPAGFLNWAQGQPKRCLAALAAGLASVVPLNQSLDYGRRQVPLTILRYGDSDLPAHECRLDTPLGSPQLTAEQRVNCHDKLVILDHGNGLMHGHCSCGWTSRPVSIRECHDDDGRWDPVAIQRAWRDHGADVAPPAIAIRSAL